MENVITLLRLSVQTLRLGASSIHTYRIHQSYYRFPIADFACVCVCVCYTCDIGNEDNKKPSTPWSSRAVPQPSTDLALSRLASEFERDPAHSIQYGRRLVISTIKWAECPSTIGFLRRTLAKYVTPAFCPGGHFP